MSNRRPNVLCICVDEMRADHMACSGNPTVATPAIDSLATTGTVFDRAYCNNPICMPARATMFTGLLPRDHGLRINGQSLRADLPTLPAAMAGAGYRTHAAGKLHLTPWVPNHEPPDPQRFPECLQYWNRGDITLFPEPYYGFQSVTFVGGHTGYACGPYIKWLESRGGRREQLGAKAGRPSRSGTKDAYYMNLPESLHYNRFIAEDTIRMIEDSAESDQPLFCWTSFPDPHGIMAPPREYWDMYHLDKIELPPRAENETERLPEAFRRVLAGELRPNGINNADITDDQLRENIALTYAMITHTDKEIGRILDALDRSGQRDNTIIVFTADHGDMMGDHGLLWKAFYTFEGCIRLPMIVSAPGHTGGQRTESLIAQIDMMPSLLDLCGITIPGSDWTTKETPFARGAVQSLDMYPGKSWASLLRDPTATIRDSVVIENDDPTMGFQVRAMVTNRYRIAVYPGSEDGELFDLAHDPDEICNLWYDAAHASLRTHLVTQLLDRYSRETPWHPIPPWNA